MECNYISMPQIIASGPDIHSSTAVTVASLEYVFTHCTFYEYVYLRSCMIQNLLNFMHPVCLSSLCNIMIIERENIFNSLIP